MVANISCNGFVNDNAKVTTARKKEVLTITKNVPTYSPNIQHILICYTI
jgi:hypothetical protein